MINIITGGSDVCFEVYSYPVVAAHCLPLKEDDIVTLFTFIYFKPQKKQATWGWRTMLAAV